MAITARLWAMIVSGESGRSSSFVEPVPVSRVSDRVIRTECESFAESMGRYPDRSPSGLHRAHRHPLPSRFFGHLVTDYSVSLYESSHCRTLHNG